ncbi:FAD-binding oxidoreductase [Devosia sp. 919]|uniref:FAD-binding oxidoreductase n=1 Tax=Devosia sp. 919 TaxID=2726065 RepID=UPI0020BDF9C2|nr:FAD-binding oxidoreductase [Devosia sp. 919]
MMRLDGWGRYPSLDGRVVAAASPDDLARLMRDGSGLVARGNGRAYGDAAMGEALTVLGRSLNRMKEFDPVSGNLTVEAGVLLSDILDTFVPRGFFPPVVPGTKLVTVGGMIASDIHGKNHHRDGGFGAYLQSLDLVVPGGETVHCSRENNSELFFATIGGMGLTGIIAQATMTLRTIETAWIDQRTVVAPDLGAALQALDDSSEATYSVAWIDCIAGGAALGRSLVYVGEHATRDQLAAAQSKRGVLAPAPRAKLGVPLELPSWTLNRASVRAFNEVYFRAGSRTEQALVHFNPYFFPLDGVDQWNRIYGRRGFLQHQCVVPPDNAHAVLSEILERFSRSGKASFLAVLKKLGDGTGPLSFPMPGYTLALDVRVTDEIFALLDEIDAIVVRAGGRLYLTKDARQSRDTFEAGYPRLDEFRQVRRAVGAKGRLQSRLSSRLGI